MATEFFSSLSVRTWKKELGATGIEFHVAELVGQEQIDAPVPGDRARQLLLTTGCGLHSG